MASGPSEAEFEAAVAVVQQHLAQKASGSVSVPTSSGAPTDASRVTPQVSDVTAALAAKAGDSAQNPSPMTPRAIGVQAPLAAVTGNSLLQVAGSPVVTVASLEASCLGRRWLDQGDGTVLDCNTRLIWLKDAGCLGAGTWGHLFTSGTVQHAVGLLNTPGDQNCHGYTAGTHTDWRVPSMREFCSAYVDSWADGTHGFCPLANYTTSLLDSRFTGIWDYRVSNAAGDGPLDLHDPFYIHPDQATYFWSADEEDVDSAWLINVQDGSILVGLKTVVSHAWAVRGPD